MKYLVPYDFTPITRSALNHALNVAQSQPGEIELLHVIAKEEDRAKAEQNFKDLLNELSSDIQKQLSTKVQVGDIFKDISRVAEENKVDWLVMGTHGAKGLQRIMGSYAIKVITGSKIPFIVTQEKGPSAVIKRIVVPIDLNKESILIIRFAAKIAKIFEAEVHLVSRPVTDEFLAKNLHNNLGMAKRFLKKEGVSYQVLSLEGKKPFHKEVIEYGAKERADLFAIAHHPESLLPQFDRFSQEIITNKLEVPVLIVKASEVTGVKTNYSFVGI